MSESARRGASGPSAAMMSTAQHRFHRSASAGTDGGISECPGHERRAGSDGQALRDQPFTCSRSRANRTEQLRQHLALLRGQLDRGLARVGVFLIVNRHVPDAIARVPAG